MNRIDTSFAANGQPFLAPTSLDMLQDAYKDGIRELALAQIGSSYSTSVPYILWGCEEGSSPIVSQGAIFFNGEVLFCAGRGSAGVGTLIASLGIAYPVSDPVTFEDGSTNNIHQIRTCNLTYGTSGTGTIGDFADFVRLQTDFVAIPSDDITWIDNSGDAPTCRRRMGGKVQLNGGFEVAMGPADATFAELPVGFRPYKDIYTIAGKSASSVFSVVPVRVTTLGKILFSNTSDVPAVGGRVYLDNIQFDINF
jgi:hypothetical protein